MLSEGVRQMACYNTHFAYSTYIPKQGNEQLPICPTRHERDPSNRSRSLIVGMSATSDSSSLG